MPVNRQLWSLRQGCAETLKIGVWKSLNWSGLNLNQFQAPVYWMCRCAFAYCVSSTIIKTENSTCCACVCVCVCVCVWERERERQRQRQAGRQAGSYNTQSHLLEPTYIPRVLDKAACVSRLCRWPEWPILLRGPKTTAVKNVVRIWGEKKYEKKWRRLEGTC